jgi:hypothetical protein
VREREEYPAALERERRERRVREKEEYPAVIGEREGGRVESNLRL